MIGTHSKYAAQALKKAERDRLEEEKRLKEEQQRRQDEFEFHALILFFKYLLVGGTMYGPFLSC